MRATDAAFNREHGITPHSVERRDQSALRLYTPDEEKESDLIAAEVDESTEHTISRLEKEMLDAAAHLEFEVAAALRDRIHALREEVQGREPTQRP